MARSSVVLPQPDGPMKRDELAARDLEVDVGQRLDRPVAGLEAQRQAADLDHRVADRRLADAVLNGR